MTNRQDDPLKIQNWFPRFSLYSLPAMFVYLRAEESDALRRGETDGDAVLEARKRLDYAMREMPHNRFVSMDLHAPTDTGRFKTKRGAVHSARSAWNILAESEILRRDAAEGNATVICIRPFRRIDPTREFRLFVYGRELSAMSQYHLTAHFPKTDKRKDFYWAKAEEFVKETDFLLPAENVVLDIYMTSQDELLVLDMNPFGEPTNPLMLNTWSADWASKPGIRMVPPPHVFSGDINVSF